MMRITLLISVVLLVAACNDSDGLTWNQRLTVTVQTPNGPISGSTVYQMFATIYPEGGQSITGSAARYGYRGEVAIVDLGQGRYIFAAPIISGDALFVLAPDRYPGLGISDRSQWLPMALENEGPLSVPAERYPRLITFRDIDEPLTADIFEAQEMGAIFGDGYGIVSIEVQVVDEPVVSGRVLEIMPWLVEFVNDLLDGSSTHRSNAEYPDANQLGAGSFSNEIRNEIEGE